MLAMDNPLTEVQVVRRPEDHNGPERGLVDQKPGNALLPKPKEQEVKSMCHHLQARKFQPGPQEILAAVVEGVFSFSFRKKETQS